MIRILITVIGPLCTGLHKRLITKQQRRFLKILAYVPTSNETKFIMKLHYLKEKIIDQDFQNAQTSVPLDP